MPSDAGAVFSKPMSQSDLQFTKGSLRVKQTISYIKWTGYLGEHYRNSDSWAMRALILKEGTKWGKSHKYHIQIQKSCKTKYLKRIYILVSNNLDTKHMKLKIE